MLLTRILSALVFAPALFWVLYQGAIWMDATCAIISMLMLWEFFGMTRAQSLPIIRGAGYLLGLFLVVATYGWLVAPYSMIVLPLGVLLLLMLSLVKPDPIEASIQRVAIVAFGVLYCCALFPFLARLRSMEPGGLQLSVIALFCTWGSDTCAYFSGRFLGKHKLYPAISPKKTIEGAVGGILGGIAVAFVIEAVLGSEIPTHHLAALGALAAFFGVFGDLAASMLKRSTNTKDSSQLIPGHGGVLDRFDGVMFAAPTIYIYAILFLA